MRAIVAALLSVMRVGSAAAAEPDQALIEAAREERSIVWYGTLIIDQIVRQWPLGWRARDDDQVNRRTMRISVPPDLVIANASMVRLTFSLDSAVAVG